MRDRYDGTSRQFWIQSTLDRLRLDAFMSEKSNTSEGLKQMIQVIRSVMPQNPPGFRSEKHQINILREAVFTKTWARSAIRAMNEAEMRFEQFAERLLRSVQYEKDVELRTGNAFSRTSCRTMRTTTPTPTFSATDVTPVMFASTSALAPVVISRRIRRVIVSEGPTAGRLLLKIEECPLKKRVV